MRHIYSHLSMSAQTPLVLLFTFSLLNPFAIASDWSYDDQELWSHHSRDCAGMKQSPINIETSNTAINSTLKLEFYGYQNQIFGFQVVNNGHSVQFTYIGDERSAPIMSGPALNNENYSLAQFHFHWGLERGQGSEHTIDGKSYSMELHLVHFNRNRYNSLSDALGSPKGVAVLGIFFQIERQNNPNLEEITRLVHVVSDRASNYTVNPDVPIVPEGLLLDTYKRSRFYRYNGSLTTPPCTEGITWLVMADTNVIGLEQIEKFRKVKDVQNDHLVGNNFRKTQNLRNRVVEASFDAHKDSSVSISLNNFAIILCMSSFFIFNRLSLH